MSFFQNIAGEGGGVRVKYHFFRTVLTKVQTARFVRSNRDLYRPKKVLRSSLAS